MRLLCFVALLFVCIMDTGVAQGQDATKSQQVTQELRAVISGLQKELSVGQTKFRNYLQRRDQTEQVLAPGFSVQIMKGAATLLEARLAFYRRRVSQLRNSVNLLTEQKRKTEEAYLEQVGFNEASLVDAQNLLEKAPGSVKDMVKLLENTVSAYKNAISVAQADTLKSFSSTKSTLSTHLHLFRQARDKLKEIETLMTKASDALRLEYGKYENNPSKDPALKQSYSLTQLSVLTTLIKAIQELAKTELNTPKNPDEGWGQIVSDEDETANAGPQIVGLAMTKDDGPPEVLGALSASMDKDTAEARAALARPGGLTQPDLPPQHATRPGAAQPWASNCKVCTDIPSCENCTQCVTKARTCDVCEQAICMDGKIGVPVLEAPAVPSQPQLPVVPGASRATESLQCVRCPAEQPTCSANCEQCSVTPRDCRTCSMAICSKMCAVCPTTPPTCDDDCLVCISSKRTCESCPVAMCKKKKALITFASTLSFESNAGSIKRIGESTNWESTSSLSRLVKSNPYNFVGFRFRPSQPLGDIYMLAFQTVTDSLPAPAPAPAPAPSFLHVSGGPTPIAPVATRRAPLVATQEDDNEQVFRAPVSGKPVFSLLEMGSTTKRGARHLVQRMARGLQPASAGGVAVGKTGLTILGNDVILYCNGRVSKLEPGLAVGAKTFSVVANDESMVEFAKNGLIFHTCETPIQFPMDVVFSSPAAGANPTDVQWIRLVDRVIP